ncbi:MAG: YbfB/YjiJ family MFS transporter [Burkholderiales bacterium]
MVRTPLGIALAAAASLAAAIGIGRFAFTPLLPLMQEHDGLSLAQGGLLASANYIGYFVGALLATRVARVPLTVTLLVIAAVTAAMGVAHGMTAWLLLRFLAGVASAWALVGVSAWALPRMNAQLGGIVFAGVGFGMVLAGGACLALTQAGASAAQAWLALGVVAALIALAVAPIVVNDRPARARARADGLAWSSETWRLVLCYGAFGFGYIIPATYVPAMARALVPDPAVFGWAWPIFGAAAAASTVLAPRSLGNRRLWALSALVMAIGVAAPLLVPGAAGVLTSAVLVGATFMVITMAGMQEARAVAGVAAAPLMAAMTAAFAAGQIAGPLVVSALANLRGGIAFALAAASAFLLVSAIALVLKEKPCPT